MCVCDNTSLRRRKQVSWILSDAIHVNRSSTECAGGPGVSSRRRWPNPCAAPTATSLNHKSACARRVRARHPRAVIAPTHTDALAHYSTSRRIKRADPGAIGVDGRPSASTDGDPTDARLWGCGARVISSNSSRARPRPRAARPLAARIPRVARRASHFARDVRAARARERLDRPRMARRSTRAATPSPETPSRAATRGAERGAGAALVFMVFVFFAAWSFGSLQYDRVDTRS